MNLNSQFFNDILHHTTPNILPNVIIDGPLNETKEYEKLVSILPKREDFLWNRVVLNYSAKLVDPDLVFDGLEMQDLINNLEKLYDNTIEGLFLYYYEINILNWKVIQGENDEYYYVSGNEKIEQYTIQILVCKALCEDYNKLHLYIDGFLKGLSTRK